MDSRALHLALGALLGLIGQLSSLAAQGAEEKPPVVPPTRFRFAAVSDRSLGLWQNERPVFVYNHGSISSANAPNAQSHSAYLHPVYGLDGEVLTDDFPTDHDYHRGLYWAWPHIRIDGQEYDSWSLRGIRYEFQRWVTRETKSDLAVLGVENAWFVGDKKVMDETVRIEVHPAISQNRTIDVELIWRPTDHPITLSGAPGKSYGGLTLRFGPRSKTIITVPTGRSSQDLLMTKLPWADLSGDLDRTTGALSGVAIFVPREHPDYPPTWMTREYGLLAVGWPGINPQTFAPGKSFSCRYRLVVHRGAPEAAEMQRAYEAYCATVQPAQENQK